MYYIKSALTTTMQVAILVVLLHAQSFACSFPEIFIHHHGYPVATDVDGGPNTWFNPVIAGQYDGCGLGIHDRSNFSVKGGDIHSTHVFKYYAIIGNSRHTCENYDVYGADSPITKRYKDICTNSTDHKAPGICLVYESQALSWAFSDCVTRLPINNKLFNIDKEYPEMDALMDLDNCMSNSLAGGIADYPDKGTRACFPFPLPPSPPPFCPNQTITATQTAAYLPICEKDYTTKGICGEPVTTGYSTYFKPCARVTFENHISVPTSLNYSSRLLPLCSKEPSNPRCINILQNDANNTNSHTMAAITDTGYVEAIYNKTVQTTQIQTRWTTDPQVTPLQFYGYNLAEFQDLCFDFNKTLGTHQSVVLDNYGSARTFRTCTPVGDDTSYCIEEQSGTGSNICTSKAPYCFSRPNMEKPQVSFCPENSGLNNANNYCMKVNFNGQTLKFTKNKKTQNIFRSMETNNNYDTPTSTNTQTCKPYYDIRNNQYSKTGNTPCQYYGGLYYDSTNYISGANKFCLVGYESNKPTNTVCTDADLAPGTVANQQISHRSVPARSTALPLGTGDCCNASAEDTGNPCSLGVGKQIRSKNPLEEGLCVDIIPFEFQDCSQFQASKDQKAKDAITEEEAQAMRNQCAAYQAFCTQINSSNNGYVNADACNKNYIDCSADSSPRSSVPGVSSSNICNFLLIAKPD